MESPRTNIRPDGVFGLDGDALAQEVQASSEDLAEYRVHNVDLPWGVMEAKANSGLSEENDHDK